MATGPANPIARYVQEVVGSHDAVALTDSQLLERFVTRRDESAFHALLRRHGPMVLGVCRRLLHDPHQADDAFQATFLVLVRRAGAIGRREALGAWLYRVAFRIAMRAKMRTDRQRHREEPFADVPAPSAGGPGSSDLRRVLDEELNRLPKKYRDPLVLRYLEEKPDPIVAAQLCWPLGTVKTRLAKARDLLRARLARRGLPLTAVALEAALGETTSAAVPAVLAEATAQAALLAAAGQTAGTAGAILMTEGVLQEMLRTKLTKSVFGAVIALGLLAAGTGWLLTELQADKPAAPEQAAPRAALIRATVPPELEWMPNNATGFLSVQVASLWDGPMGQELRRQVPNEKLDNANLIGNRLGWNEKVNEPLSDKALGLDLPNLKRLTISLAIPTADGLFPLVAITTRAPYARDKVLRGIVPGAKELKLQDKSYYAGKGASALYFVDAHTFLIFPEILAAKLLPEVQPKKIAGSLHGGLTLASITPIVFAMNPGALDGTVKVDQLPESFGSLLETKAVSFGIAPGKELKADLFLSFPNAKTKDEGAKAVKLAVVLAEAALAQQRQAIAANPKGLENVLKVIGQMKAALKAVPVREEGNRLHVPLRVQVDDRMVAAAIGEALAVAIPQAHNAAQRISSVNNLKEIALAMHKYHDAENKFPAAALFGKDGKPHLSWRVAILPYLGEKEKALYKEFKLDEPWDSEHNRKLLVRMPKIFAAPGETPKEPFATFYQVFNSKGALFDGKQQLTLAQITNGDGASNSLLAVEAGTAVPWTKPEDLSYAPDKPLPKLGGLREDDFAAAFADGHVRTLLKKLDEKTIRAIITWNGGEQVTLP